MQVNVRRVAAFTVCISCGYGHEKRLVTLDISGRFLGCHLSRSTGPSYHHKILILSHLETSELGGGSPDKRRSLEAWKL